MLTMEKPSWAEGLRPCGTYFEGFVDDATTIVEKCKADTLTTFGTRTSRMAQGDSSKSSYKENLVSSSKITPLQLYALMRPSFIPCQLNTLTN